MKFTKNDLQAVALAASKDESRFGINGVRFESDRLLATDGHRIHVVKGEALKLNEPFTLELGAVKKAIRSLDSKETSTPEDQIGLRVDVDFPDLGMCYPKQEPAVRVRINALYLRDMCDAAIKAEKVLSKDGHVDLTLSIVDSSSAVLCEGGEGAFEGLLMPMRLEAKSK